MADELNMGNLGTLPPELYQQQQELNRRQQMAQALLGQTSQQPQGQMISGRYVAPSIFQQLQPLMAAYTGANLAKEGDAKAAELAKAIREGKSAVEEKIIQSLTPKPSQLTELAGPAYKGQAPVAYQPAQEPNLAEAARLIRTNQFGAGKEYMPEVIKRMLPETPTSVQEFEFAKKHPEYMNYRTGLASAGANKQFLSVTNQLPFKEQIQKEAATGLMTDFNTLKNIPAALQNMDKMVELSKQPIFAGVGGESKLQIAKLLNNNFGTNISPEAVKNTEEFRSAAYMGIMDNLKKTDSNPTATQQNALKEAIGSLGTDPAAIPRVVNVMRDVMLTKAKQHNELVDQTVKKGVEYPYDIRIQLPQEKSTNPNNGMLGNIDTNSLDAILRSRGALK